MSGISWEMDLVNFMNPLYALPIVGVVVCALVVYAFGFRSVQPPNFEEIEVEKKVGRRRRQKQSRKTRKERNADLPKKSQDASSSKSGKKGNIDKSLSIEESEGKLSRKVKNKAKETTSSVDQASICDDDDGDGWNVCPPGRKGKKKRKQDGSTASENSVLDFDPGKEKILQSDHLDLPYNPEANVQKKKHIKQVIPDDLNSYDPERDSEHIDSDADILSSKELMHGQIPSRHEMTVDVLDDLPYNLEKNKQTKNKKPSKHEEPVGWNVSPPVKKGKKKRKQDDSTNMEACTSENSIAGFDRGMEKTNDLELRHSPEKKLQNKKPLEHLQPGKQSEDMEEKGNGKSGVFDEINELFPIPKETQKKKKGKARRDH